MAYHPRVIRLFYGAREGTWREKKLSSAHEIIFFLAMSLRGFRTFYSFMLFDKFKDNLSAENFSC